MDWCDRAAAEFACRRWHYSGTLSTGKLVTIGAWEAGRFQGAVVFGRGAGPQVGQWFGALVGRETVPQSEFCELVRVALAPDEARGGGRQTPTSRIIAVALRMLRRQSPGLGFVVSFADETNEGHVGTVYQATNWIYLGRSEARHLLINGRERHSRIQVERFRRRHPNAEIGYTETKVKHRYVYPLDEEWRERFEALAEPYPKRD